MRCVAALACCILALSSCQREKRDVRPAPIRTAVVGEAARESPLEPGGALPHYQPSNPYDKSAYAISEGQRLFSAFNCVGCHFHGGGGMGPALMDDEWRYGGRIDQIAASIAEGRPNGMPSWRGKLTDDQIWKLAAYVRSLSGLPSKDAVSSRSESMSAGTPQSLTPHGQVQPSDTADQ